MLTLLLDFVTCKFVRDLGDKFLRHDADCGILARALNAKAGVYAFLVCQAYRKLAPDIYYVGLGGSYFVKLQLPAIAHSHYLMIASVGKFTEASGANRLSIVVIDGQPSSVDHQILKGGPQGATLSVHARLLHTNTLQCFSERLSRWQYPPDLGSSIRAAVRQLKIFLITLTLALHFSFKPWAQWPLPPR